MNIYCFLCTIKFAGNIDLGKPYSLAFERIAEKQMESLDNEKNKIKIKNRWENAW